MKEKRGQTELLKYDFPTEKNCQVQLNGKWYRATPREFRSWNGGRRIIFYPNQQEQIQEYFGPLYYWNTNKICKEPINEGTQYISSMPWRSIVRPGDMKFLEK